MNRTTLFALIAVAVFLSACSYLPGQKKQEAGLANPAAVFCNEHGGRSTITTNPDGSQGGMCVFADGSQCDEWAFFRGECSAGSSASLAQNFPTFDPAQGTCTNFTNQASDEGLVNADDKPAQWKATAMQGKTNTIPANGTIMLGLQNVNGGTTDTFNYEVTVMTPESTFSGANGTTTGVEVSETTYPKDYNVGSTAKPGTYSVVFTVNSQLIACTGFTVK